MVEAKTQDPILEAMVREAKRDYFGSGFKWPEMQEVHYPRDSVLAKIGQYLNDTLDSHGNIIIITVHASQGSEEIRTFLIGNDYYYSDSDKQNTINNPVTTFPRIRIRIPTIFKNQPQIDIETPNNKPLKIVDFLSPGNPEGIDQVVGILAIESNSQFGSPVLNYSNYKQPSYKINNRFLETSQISAFLASRARQRP